MPASPCCSIAYLWTGREEETGRPRLPTRPPAPCLVLLFPTSVPPCSRQPASCSGGKAGRGLPRLVPSQQARRRGGRAARRPTHWRQHEERHTSRSSVHPFVPGCTLGTAVDNARAARTREEGKDHEDQNRTHARATSREVANEGMSQRCARADCRVAKGPGEEEPSLARRAVSCSLSLCVIGRACLPACLPLGPGGCCCCRVPHAARSRAMLTHLFLHLRPLRHRVRGPGSWPLWRDAWKASQAGKGAASSPVRREEESCYTHSAQQRLDARAPSRPSVAPSSRPASSDLGGPGALGGHRRRTR